MIASMVNTNHMSIRSVIVSFDGATLELRKSKRYRPALAPVLFAWEGPDGILHEGKGIARDISDRGVFVVALSCPPVNARVDVDVHLPSLEVKGGAVELHGEGKVVRVDSEMESIRGFAASVAFRTELGSRLTANKATIQ
jgi:hypothetical protein